MNEAELLGQYGYWNACVNRLYYACFYAVSAVLIARGHSAAKHTGIRSLFNRTLVRTGTVPIERAALYNSLFEHRHEADYDSLAEFQAAQVEPWVDQAREFAAGMESLLGQSGQTDRPNLAAPSG